MSNTNRNDVKQISEKIEVLARDLQSQLGSGSDFLPVANELVRNSLLMVFTAGEVYALEQTSGKTVQAQVVSAPKHKNANWYNHRDPATGKFAKK